MNALIIETYTHFDTFKTVKQILLNIGYEVDEVRKFSAIKSSNLEKYDLIYINTIYGRQTFRYKKILSKINRSSVKVIIGVHNSHVMFFDRLPNQEKKAILDYYKKHYSEFFNVKIPRILIDLYIYSLNSIMKKIRMSIDGIVIFGDYLTCLQDPCVKIPTRITDENILSTRIERVKDISIPTFVIPGGVSDAMRNYSEFLERLKIEKLDIKVKLLGRMISHRIKELIHNDEYLRKVVRFYDKFIPDTVFIDEMSRSHFAILIPRYIPPYGKYIATGGFHDAVSVGVPLIIPDNFSKDINGPMVRYKNIDHLMEIIKELSYNTIKGKYTDRYLKPFLGYAKKFTLNQVQSRFENFLKEIGVL